MPFSITFQSLVRTKLYHAVIPEGGGRVGGARRVNLDKREERVTMLISKTNTAKCFTESKKARGKIERVGDIFLAQSHYTVRRPHHRLKPKSPKPTIFPFC